MNNLKINNSTFEEIKRIDEFGNEYWSARELMKVLEYSTWQKFEKVVSNAKIACKRSNFRVDDHFNQMVKMVQLGSSASRKINDYSLSRYACYLIVQNADSSKDYIMVKKLMILLEERGFDIVKIF